MATRSPRPDAPSVDEWSDLLDQAEFEPIGNHARKTVVDVPDSAVALVEKARGQRFYKTVRDAADYDRQSLILYSAGLKANPPATVLVVPGIGVGDKFARVEDVNNATHLRASVGAKRGAKAK